MTEVVCQVSDPTLRMRLMPTACSPTGGLRWGSLYVMRSVHSTSSSASTDSYHPLHFLMSSSAHYVSPFHKDYSRALELGAVIYTVKLKRRECKVPWTQAILRKAENYSGADTDQVAGYLLRWGRLQVEPALHRACLAYRYLLGRCRSNLG